MRVGSYGITADELHDKIVEAVASHCRHFGDEDWARRIESDQHPLEQIITGIIHSARIAEAKR